ncbi:MAG TPA: (2Fe-2S)-binding protein, partial [Clostridiales bacterium]|nr:(2Fe-2S)-binding protein [Clostridiales bacterium]
MQIKLWINDKEYIDDISPDTILLDFLRSKGCLSVKRGCETSNCGLCTVLMQGKPILSCSTLAVRANGLRVTTIEGMQEEASDFGGFLADEGAEQCGFCSPGFIINVIAMKNELKNPTEDEIKNYLEGNLCRCTGYMGQLRAVK